MLISSILRDCVIEIIKAQPGREDLDPGALEEAIERAGIRVSNFCRLRVIPMALKYALADIVSDTYDMLKPTIQDDDFNTRLKSIKQGDTTYELDTVSKKEYASMDEIIKAHELDLLPYRGIFWR